MKHNFNKLILSVFTLCVLVSAAQAASVSVASYGALGDNFTDDRLAIQNAINAVAGTGNTLYFPTGMYIISGTLYVPSDIRIEGMGSFFNCQLRFTATQAPLFEVGDGKSNITFKDLTLIGWNRQVYPRYTPAETALLRQEGTIGISLKAAGSGISNIVVENVRINQFTQGMSATSSITGYDASISNVKIRNYASDGNEYSLYTNTRGADNWDVQNMNVYPMYHDQNGIFLELSGKMSFLQLSCAGGGAGICAKLWGNGDTYFRQMHVEGPRLGFCVGSNCDGSSGNTGVNASVLTVENSATGGEIHRATNLVLINNRFWKDYPLPGAPLDAPYKFLGTGTNSGANSWVMSCGNVWVSWHPTTHMTNTTVTAPSGGYPGLATTLNGCVGYYLSSVPAFAQGYAADNGQLTGQLNVTNYGAVAGDGNDDSAAFVAALAAANSSGYYIKRVFVPAGTYDIDSTVQLYGGETIYGESGSVINLRGRNHSLFKVIATAAVVKGITLRNLLLTAATTTGTSGINLESTSTTVSGGASDFQIQGVDFNGFEAGIVVQPACNPFSVSSVCGDITDANPMYDSVSLKDADFTDNKTAILIRSQNASNWNLENISVTIPNGEEGVRVDGIGHLNVRNLSCTSSGTGAVCVSVQRQNGLAIDGLSATNVTNALVARWENGWTQFPFTLRNSNLTAGVYFQGRVYLNSVNNIYPARLGRNSTSKVVRFGAYQEGDVQNTAYGGQSDIFSCNDSFVDSSNPLLSSVGWSYSGVLTPPITYCY